MKKQTNFIFLLILAISLGSCNSASSEKKTEALPLSDNIQIYYFHNTKRCATCNAVENETKTALEMFYKEQVEQGAIEFTSMNLEEEEGKSIANALGIAGQTLLLVKGENKVNLTNQGFMNARKSLSEFHLILRQEIDKLF